MIINYFTPPQYVKHPFKVDDILQELGGWKYASKGRWCLYHILKSLDIKGPVLIPIYCCDSILIPIKELGLKWYCYDINADDLNANIWSVEKAIDEYHADCIVAVSMYGNPAELDRLEEVCKSKGVKLIDDAAQSFGASLNGKKVGYFGDAGFFSFSPGKPLAGHMGGAFRTSNSDYKIKYVRHLLAHWIIKKDFEYNRKENHFRKDIKGKLYGLGCRIVNKLFDIRNDGVCSFEEGDLYGIYKDSLYIHNTYRTAYAVKMADEIHSDVIKVLKPYDDNYRKGIAYKYILVCKTKILAEQLNNYLHEQNISSQRGYDLICSCESFANAKLIDGCVVEIPLNAEKEQYEYINKTLNLFIKKTS